MNPKVLSLLAVIMFLCTLPFTAYAQNDGVVNTIEKGKGHHAKFNADGTIDGKKAKTVSRMAFKNVQTGIVQPESWGVATIQCTDEGDHWMGCGWNLTTTAKMTHINLELTFSTGAFTMYNYDIIPAVYQVWNAAEDYIDIPGTYYAALEGLVTTTDGIYELEPIWSEDVEMN